MLLFVRFGYWVVLSVLSTGPVLLYWWAGSRGVGVQGGLDQVNQTIDITTGSKCCGMCDPVMGSWMACNRFWGLLGGVLEAYNGMQADGVRSAFLSIPSRGHPPFHSSLLE